MDSITIIEGNSRVVKNPVNTELFTPELIQQMEDASGYYGTVTPEQAQNGINQIPESPGTPKEKENLWTKYKVPIILGGSVVVIGLLYWLFFMRKK